MVRPGAARRACGIRYKGLDLAWADTMAFLRHMKQKGAIV